MPSNCPGPSRYLPLIAALCVLLLAFSWAFPFSVDDAFIVFRYAARLRDGAGYSFNDGAVTDGVTGPLWLFWLVLGGALGVELEWFAKLTGALMMGAASALSISAARARALGSRSAWLTGALCVSSLPLVAWGSAGLETGAATLVATLCLLSAVRRPAPRPWSTGLCAACLLWLRPETVGLGACSVAIVVARDRRGAVRAFSAFVAGALALGAFRYGLFGHLLPLSYHAKPALLGQGLRYMASLALAPSAVLILPWLWHALRWGDSFDRQVCWGVAVHASCVVLAGGDWMPGGRLWAPAVPAMALVVGRAVARWSCRVRTGGWRSAILWFLVPATLLVRAGHLGQELTEVRRAGRLRSLRAPELAGRLRPFGSPIAMVDIGAVGYLLPERDFLDLGGLIEPAIASQKGTHLDKVLDSDWLRAQRPAVFALHSRERPLLDGRGRIRWFNGYPVERRVLALPWVMRDYRVVDVFEYSPDYFYVLLSSGGRR